MTTQSAIGVQAGQMAAYGALPVPRVTPEMLSLVRTGTVYSLAVIHREGMPVPGPMVPYTLTPRLRHGDPLNIAPATAAAEAITMAAHTGTLRPRLIASSSSCSSSLRVLSGWAFRRLMSPALSSVPFRHKPFYSTFIPLAVATAPLGRVCKLGKRKTGIAKSV